MSTPTAAAAAAAAAPPPLPPPPPRTLFEVRVAKEAFKFTAAHFVTFNGFREKLHGHNYQVGVRLLGSQRIGHDGYVVDFGDIKATTKKVCKDLNEHFLCPMLSDVMTITTRTATAAASATESIQLDCQDGSVFLFPKQDCALLPIVHATTEELAIYIWGKILNGLEACFLRQRGIHTMEVTVAEAAGQEATFRYEIPDVVESDFMLDVKRFITSGEIVPTPCLETKDCDAAAAAACNGTCKASKHIFSTKLQKLADSINNGALKEKQTANDGRVTAEDLEQMTLP